MAKVQSLIIDAWIREAQDATKLVEDLEDRIKNKNLAQERRLRDTVQSKLLEVGVKLDRLESLLHNPSPVPILTDEDLEYRWKLLSDIQLRTRTIALSFYALPSPNTNRAGVLPDVDIKENKSSSDNYAKDQISVSFSKDDLELLKPLVSETATRSQVQMKRSGSSVSMSLLRRVCCVIFMTLGGAAVLFILILLCAVI